MVVDNDEALLEAIGDTLKTKWEVDIFCEHPVDVPVRVNDSQIVLVPPTIQDEVDVDDHPPNMEEQTQDALDPEEQTQDAPDPEELIQQEQHEFMAETATQRQDEVQQDAGDNVQQDAGETVQQNAGDNVQQEAGETVQQDARENVQQESGFELSDDEIHVDGDAIDIGLSVLRGKGKAVLSDTDTSLDMDAEIGVESDSSEDEVPEIPESSGANKFRDYRNLKKKLPSFTEFKEADMQNPSFKLGLVFKSSKLFKQAIREYSIKAGKNIYFKKNDSDRVRAECKDPNCKWTCYASVLGDTGTFIIKTLRPEHTCARVNINSFATATWLSKKYMQQIKDSESLTAADIMNRVQQDFVLECSKEKAYRVKKIAKKAIEGSLKEQYAALWNYGAELKRSNPGSTIQFETETDSEGQTIFKRMYVCFQGYKSASCCS